jgi:hypothetical protein
VSRKAADVVLAAEFQQTRAERKFSHFKKSETEKLFHQSASGVKKATSADWKICIFSEQKTTTPVSPFTEEEIFCDRFFTFFRR